MDRSVNYLWVDQVSNEWSNRQGCKQLTCFLILIYFHQPNLNSMTRKSMSKVAIQARFRTVGETHAKWQTFKKPDVREKCMVVSINSTVIHLFVVCCCCCCCFIFKCLPSWVCLAYFPSLNLTDCVTKGWFSYSRPGRPSRSNANTSETTQDDRKRPGRLGRSRSLG